MQKFFTNFLFIYSNELFYIQTYAHTSSGECGRRDFVWIGMISVVTLLFFHSISIICFPFSLHSVEFHVDYTICSDTVKTDVHIMFYFSLQSSKKSHNEFEMHSSFVAGKFAHFLFVFLDTENVEEIPPQIALLLKFWGKRWFPIQDSQMKTGGIICRLAQAHNLICFAIESINKILKKLPSKWSRIENSPFKLSSGIVSSISQSIKQWNRLNLLINMPPCN